MYSLAKLCMRLAFLALLYCLVLVSVIVPLVGIVALCLIVIRLRRRRKARLTAMGTAAWATLKEMRQAGMLDAKSGVSVGVVERQRSRIEWWEKRSHLVRLPQAVHTAVFSPTGQGKGVSFVIPYLLTNRDSCVCLDLKGENAKITARHRRRMGQRVVILDPFQAVTNSPDSLNPLDFIDPASPTGLDDCIDLAKALVVRTGEEKEPHWNDAAETWLAAVIALVAAEPRSENRSLQTVRDIFSNPQWLDAAIQAMLESDAWGGMLARMGGQLQHYVDKERSSVLTTVNRFLRFLDTLPVAASTRRSTFDPSALRSGKLTVYLVLPPERMRAQSALLRMWIGALLRACVKGGLGEHGKVHFLLDEAASLGHLEPIDDALDKYRGYGVRLIFFFQSIGQLKKCFPNGQEQTLLSNVSQVYFAVSDNETAELVSKRLGEETIVVESGGSNRNRNSSWSQGMMMKDSLGRSSGSSSNWSQQARKLLKPEEIIALHPREAITFTPGVRPILTTLTRYYEQRRRAWIIRAGKACFTLAVSAGAMLLAVGLAAHLTIAITQKEIRHEHGERQAVQRHEPAAGQRRPASGVPSGQGNRDGTETSWHFGNVGTGQRDVQRPRLPPDGQRAKPGGAGERPGGRPRGGQ